MCGSDLVEQCLKHIDTEHACIRKAFFMPCGVVFGTGSVCVGWWSLSTSGFWRYGLPWRFCGCWNCCSWALSGFVYPTVDSTISAPLKSLWLNCSGFATKERLWRFPSLGLIRFLFRLFFFIVIVSRIAGYRRRRDDFRPFLMLSWGDNLRSRDWLRLVCLKRFFDWLRRIDGCTSLLF
jgi:hypothetical protein